MRGKSLARSFATLVVFVAAPSFAENRGPPEGKWFCVIEKAAGILYDQQTHSSVPRVVRLNDGKFLLTISKIKRGDWERNFCKSSLEHWESFLYSGKDFPDRLDGGSKYDYRINMGPNCFADYMAVTKYFGDSSPTQLVSYDFTPWSFSRLPGTWMTFGLAAKDPTGLTFKGSQPLDDGPVVIQGSCERISG